MHSYAFVVIMLLMIKHSKPKMLLTAKIKQIKQTKTHSKPASLLDSVMIVVEAADPGSVAPSPDLGSGAHSSAAPQQHSPVWPLKKLLLLVVQSNHKLPVSLNRVGYLQGELS